MSNLLFVQIQTARLLNYLIKFQTCSTFHEFSYFSSLLLQRNDKKRFHFENNFCQMAWRTHSHVFLPIRQTNESEFCIFANNFVLIRENSAYLHCLKEGGKVVSKVKKKLNLLKSIKFIEAKKIYLLKSIKSIIRKISTHNCPLSKVFCLPHYYRKDVIPPTGVYK